MHESVTPDQLEVGDIVMCFAHDDQLEQANARIVRIDRDDRHYLWCFRDNRGREYRYAVTYTIWLTCHHLNRHGNPKNQPSYIWHRFPWNTTTRYLSRPQKEEG